MKGLAHTSSVNDTILPFAKPEFSSLQQHPMNFGPAVPRWKPSFYVYRFILLFSLILSTLVRDRERRTGHGFITGRDRKTEAKPGRDSRRLSPAFLSQLRSGSHNQPSFCVFLLFFLFFFDTLCKHNLVMHPHHNIKQKREGQGETRAKEARREKGNTDRPRIRAKIDTNRTRVYQQRSPFAMTQ